jgi:hypothetical protein
MELGVPSIDGAMTNSSKILQLMVGSREIQRGIGKS